MRVDDVASNVCQALPTGTFGASSGAGEGAGHGARPSSAAPGLTRLSMTAAHYVKDWTTAGPGRYYSPRH